LTGIVESKKSHVAAVFNNLREDDRNEIEALGKDPFMSLKQGFKASKPCYTWMYKDEPSALFGCVPFSEQAAAVWMLGTDNIANHKYAFMKTCVPFHKQLVRPYALTGNIIDERNKVHVRFIEHLGYQIINRVLVGPKQLPFLEFGRLNHV
tara:strand:- start:3157 stop:3609 length:453 start_codon:yes stop_codon:yes gene_type:complete